MEKFLISYAAMCGELFRKKIQDKELLNTKPESENALMQVQCSWIVQLTGSANWTLSRCEQGYPRPTTNSH